MARRCNNQVAGVLGRDVERQAVERLDAQTGKARASLLFDLHVARRQDQPVGVDPFERLHGGSRRNDFAAIIERQAGHRQRKCFVTPGIVHVPKVV